MKSSYYVEQQLAKQLMNETKELKIKQILVDGLRKKIADKKVECISNILLGNLLKLNDQRFLVLDVRNRISDDILRVTVFFGMPIEDVVNGGMKLTIKEKHLLKKYEHDWLQVKKYQYDWSGRDAINMAEDLVLLKNKIDLIQEWTWSFRWEDAQSDYFYDESNLYHNDNDGRGRCLLESFIIEKKG
jgi:hypothetical protein